MNRGSGHKLLRSLLILGRTWAGHFPLWVLHFHSQDAEKRLQILLSPVRILISLNTSSSGKSPLALFATVFGNTKRYLLWI